MPAIIAPITLVILSSRNKVLLASWSNIFNAFLYALDKIKNNGLDIAILTNNSEDVVNRVLPSLKLDSIIKTVIGSERLNPLLKPETKAYKKALKILDHEASKTLFLDDSITNVIGAMVAGITSVYIGDSDDKDAAIRYKTLHSFLRANA